MTFQVLFWLLAATDDHAKNFSLFIAADGGYRLVTFYDILCTKRVIKGKGLNISDAKLALSLKATQGKKNQIKQISLRYFIKTAKSLAFDTAIMMEIMLDFANMAEVLVVKVKVQLPDDFPAHIRDSILNDLINLVKRIV
jgi:serine/threonine-protein kinase HipA